MLFIAIAVALALPSLIVMIYLSTTTKKKLISFFVIPYVLASLYLVWSHLEMIKGLPTTVLPKDFQFIYSYDAAPDFIYLWVLDDSDKVIKTIQIPWSENMTKKMADANNIVKNGYGLERHEGKEPKRESGINSNDNSFMLHLIDVGKKYKK